MQTQRVLQRDNSSECGVCWLRLSASARVRVNRKTRKVRATGYESEDEWSAKTKVIRTKNKFEGRKRLLEARALC